MHIAALVALDRLPDWQLQQPQAIRDIAVEIITRVPAAPPPPPVVPSKSSKTEIKRPATAAPRQTEAPAAPGMIKAQTLYAATALADPRSRRARTRLRMLVSEDRIIQLCNLEALEQTARWDEKLKPDYLVAYARKEVRIAGSWLEVDGGALHSGNNWLEIKYRCQAASNLESVSAFEFKVGKKIPRHLWEQFSLPSQITAHD